MYIALYILCFLIHIFYLNYNSKSKVIVCPLVSGINILKIKVKRLRTHVTVI